LGIKIISPRPLGEITGPEVRGHPSGPCVAPARRGGPGKEP